MSLHNIIDLDVIKIVFSVAIGAISSYVGLYNSIQDNARDIKTHTEFREKAENTLNEISREMTEIKIMVGRIYNEK